jgi:hypothetical protein
MDNTRFDGPAHSAAVQATALSDKSRAPGGNNLNKINERDADRVVPRPGEAQEHVHVHDTATHPDKVKPDPDDSGQRPRPL